MTTDTFDTDSISDTGENLISDSIMPNLVGFTKPESGIQGGWYWYDETATTTEVYSIANDSESRYDWFNVGKKIFYCENTDLTGCVDYAKTTSSDKICLKGEDVIEGENYDNDSNYIALGFELCSPERPMDTKKLYEIPKVLGECDRLNERLKRISFHIEPQNTDHPFMVIVQFKQWGTDDVSQPECDVYPGNTEASDSDEPCRVEEDTDGAGYKIIADVENIKNQNGDDINPYMVQAVHFEIFGLSEFCISNVTAYQPKDTPNNNDNNSANIGYPVKIPVDTKTAPLIEDPISPPSDSEMGFISLSNILESDTDTEKEWPDGGPFEIMQAEVNVKQYNNFRLQWGECDEDENPYCTQEWKSCSFSYRDDPDKNEKAVNCVTWRQARDYCRWIGGQLPSEAQWLFAYDNATNDEPLNCPNAVMNNVDSGGNVGCGNDRLPEKGCTHPPDDTESLCDMMGNLWEWVSDSYTNSDPETDTDTDDDWLKDFYMLKGGSLNSPSLNRDMTSYDHPSTPRSPTRIGFRCIKYVTSDTDASTDPQ